MKRSARFYRWSTILLFLLPSLLGFLVFVLVPLLASIAFAFTDYSGGFNTSFVGFDNFGKVLGNGTFHNALWNTVKYTMATVTLQLIFGLFFAVLLNYKLFGRTFFRSVIFMPVILSNIAVSLVFMLLLHPNKGPVNSFLASIGLPGLPWLSSPKTSLLTIVLVTLWQSFGYYMLLFLSGLQAINQDLYEAGEIDGANGLQRLIHITVPMLSPITFFCVIMAVINSFKVFDQVFAMTGGQLGGGPAGSTTVLVFDIYQRAFTNYEMGYASTESLILLVIVLAITIIQYCGQNRWVTYE